MDVIVIGGGIAGVATAYQLRAAGHRVCVVERHATVAQGATYGHGGTVLPTPLDVWFGPTFMASRQNAKNGVINKAGFNGPARQFVKQLAALQDPNEFGHQYGLLRPLIELSRETMADVESRFGLEFEQTSGLLYLVRSPQEWELLRPAIGLLRLHEVPHHELTPAECAAFEHSVRTEPEFAGGVLFDQERTANAPLFAKLIKQALDTQGGVQFMQGCEVSAIRLDGQRASVELAPRPGAGSTTARSREVDVVHADAVVVAAGHGSLPLLERLGLRLPLHPLRLHTLVAPIAHEECAPHVAIVDAVKRIAISRMNHRLRIAGGAVLQSAGQVDKPLGEAVTKEALALLGQATHDWIPGAARISAALSWEGVKLLSPDGLPVVGNALHPRLFVNAGHGPAGWGLACGSAKLIADLVSGATPDVPADTLAALRPERFR
ncbi:amino acid dehydrogenase [Paraburkholderia ginsengiterrae]|uniref:Amino acid dehydrogenase n=1 Tax=Paraburkholderia ginsengiterrae TaxID=1462993 RepID=A0A1A9N0J8_9BURK|nr:FAD-dependent oxidoreductase [Paraburkholderia ginsengiterrae]OAJ53344.1 amino acid dehydrogenase [Paraburkholderia ginsengiterrae]OAJ55433.1 amino acid dehydrogenase [Paraburkholderia ginsengiterrae]